MSDELLFVFGYGVAAFIAIGIVALFVLGKYLYERNRSRAFRELAKRLGLRYHRKSYGIPKQYRFLNDLARGNNRYAFNILEGVNKRRHVISFDYHYATGGGNNRRDHYVSFFMLRLEREFPELRVYPENFLSKLGQSIGFEDIDFESVEFSDAFTVRARDKKFAYDVCNTRMMAYMLEHRALAFEIERNWLAIGARGRLDVETVAGGFVFLQEVRERLPGYLFQA